MKDLKVLGHMINVKKSPVVFKYDAKNSNFLDYFDIKKGNWYHEDGYLIGKEPGNFGGIILTKASYDFDVLVTIKFGTVLPCTRDVNAVWCASWDPSTDYLGDSYVCGLSGWYDYKSGIERNYSKLYATTSLFNYKPGKIITMQFGSVNGLTFMFVDGKLVLELRDPFPLTSGHVGISPYCTILKIKKFEIRKLKYEDVSDYYDPEFKE